MPSCVRMSRRFGGSFSTCQIEALKFGESKHSALIFRRIGSAQRGGGVFVRSLEGSTSRNSGILSFGLRKSVGIFGESLGTCMLIGDLLVLHVLDIRSTEHSTCQIGVLSLKNPNIWH